MDKIIKLDIPQGYEYYGIEFDSGKILLRKKHIEYPKTFEKCCETVNIINSGIPCVMAHHLGYAITNLARLIIMREAYWKVYAENKGLDKPWQPDWNELSPKYVITALENKLVKPCALTQNYILAFPTEEMRDAFHDNFKTLIESCKDLL